jgi:hypothetical protein
VLRGAAVIAWVTTCVGTFTGFDVHPGFDDSLDLRIWFIVLSAAIVLSLAALLDHAATRSATVYAAAMRAGISLPRDGGPLVKMTTGPLAKLVALPDRRHGQHATPR